MSYRGSKEKRINSFTSANQGSPEVTTLSDGGWVATWASYGKDGNGYGISQQRFHADGTKYGGEETVNTSTTSTQYRPSIAALTDGGWVETWSSKANAVNGFDICQQPYNADGSKQGSETVVNSQSPYDQVNSHVAGLTGGGWIVTWQTADLNGVNDIHEQLYNSSGTKVGGELLVNTVTTADQFDADVAALKNGGWVVTWASYGHAGDASGIYQQIYNSSGGKVGVETHVNTYMPGNQYDPEVTVLSDGTFVTTWESQDQDGSGYGIYQQHFSEAGVAIGGEKRVNTHTVNEQDTADIAALSNGGWVVTWESDNQDGSASGIYAQAYNADGTRSGKEFRVNQHTNSEQLDPSVTGLKNDRFIIAWQSYDIDGDEGAIMSRTFRQVNNAQGVIQIVPTIEGTKHDDVLTGKNIGELLLGKGGDDTLNGQGGNDILNGGKGDDLLIGADGKDMFIFKTGFGHDTVRGFFDGDHIDLSGVTTIADFDDLMDNHASQIGSDVYIDAGNGDSLFIRHAVKGLLTAGDFTFQS